MQLDLTHVPDSPAPSADRAADELALDILRLAESGVRLDCIDAAFGLEPGAALTVWFDIAEACGAPFAVH